MSAPASDERCVCQATPATDPTAAEHEKWCPSRKPSAERIAEIKAGTGRPLMAGELEWLRGDASRAELHISGAAAGAFPLMDDLPGFVVELAQKLGAVVAEVERLRARVAELETAGHTDWRAWHDSDASMPLGQYTGRAAAMGHVHHVLAREESVSVEAIELRVRWVADDPHGPEDEPTAWECWLLDADGDDEQPTGYVVSPIEVAAAYDPDGDE